MENPQMQMSAGSCPRGTARKIEDGIEPCSVNLARMIHESFVKNPGLGAVTK
jgi:hypothetical protein